MLRILLLSSAAGVAGTTIGGLVGLLFGRKSDAVVSYLLSIAAGVMLSISFFELIPESLELAGLPLTIMAVALGVVCVGLLNLAVDAIDHTRQTHTTPEQLRHQEDLVRADSKRSMLRSGLLMFAAIALHNFPEGLAIGSGASHNQQMGVLLAVLIAIHNIPEGISIAVPLIEGGMSRGKTVALTAISGVPTLFGGLVGALVGGVGDIAVAISLGIAGGAMMYVTFCEILPQAIMLDRSRKPAIYTVGGVAFGLLMVQILS